MWSFKEEDPPNGADGTFVAHDFKGSASLNLLGGLLDRPDVPDTTDYFEVLAENVRYLVLIFVIYICYMYRCLFPLQQQHIGALASGYLIL